MTASSRATLLDLAAKLAGDARVAGQLAKELAAEGKRDEANRRLGAALGLAEASREAAIWAEAAA